MSCIKLLSQETINQIAAGEVVERPRAIVKELVENAIDAKASAITIEIKEGGTSFIRITDNGIGIEKEDIRTAFLPHATSKINHIEDLIHISSLGFRGEALASIAAVSKVELITKTARDFTGVRYLIESGEEKAMEEIGCPEGTTFIVRELFYNTPARKKFLKSAATESGYIGELVERLCISNSHISFKFLVNNQIKIHTSGNDNLKDNIYHVYGRNIAMNLLEVAEEKEFFRLNGFIGKPVISRGNRNFENYYINGRYVKDKIIQSAIEEAYESYLMTRKYPFTALSLSVPADFVDVNVHPAKMEIRFAEEKQVFDFVYHAIQKALKKKELIPEVELGQKKEERKSERIPPIQSTQEFAEKERAQPPQKEVFKKQRMEETPQKMPEKVTSSYEIPQEKLPTVIKETVENIEVAKQLEIPEILSEQAKPFHRIVGQVFSTYWMVEYEEKLFLIDQHAAHEKVIYEKLLSTYEKKEFLSQMVSPPIVVTLNLKEEAILKQSRSIFEQIGFEIEGFGGMEYAIFAVPADMYGIADDELFLEILNSLTEQNHIQTAAIVLEKIASASCKAAVKGNQTLSKEEVVQLIDELLQLQNPYHCPHGRPTMISISKYELEKKFKRIV